MFTYLKFLFSGNDPLIKAVKQLISARSAALQHNATLNELKAEQTRAANRLAQAIADHQDARIAIQDAYELKLD